MSLTNPKNVVTEERLSEFYGEILPYLGGMPEALANKFEKSNLYSTTEKIIGCWTDGKPLYQKVLSGTLAETTTEGTYVHTWLDVGASVEKFISISGYFSVDSGSRMFPILFMTLLGSSVYGQVSAAGYTNSYSTTSQRNKVRVSNPATMWNNSPVYIIAQYTKTTDAANSFKYGNETDYSTEEKIVGTWINGKPIYQKTVSCGALPNATSKNIAHNISNLDIVIQHIGYAKRASNSTYLPIPWTYSSEFNMSLDMLKGQVGVVVNGTNIVLETGINRSDFTESYITLQYTKTTD